MIARLRRAIGARRALVGVVGAVLLLAGSAWYQALVTPPYRFIDEQAHAGYVLALQEGRLPTIDTPIDADDGGAALRARLSREPSARRDVWVANNPPLTYLLAAGPSAVTRALGLPGGPVLGLRLVNVASAALAVALTYLLARDLSSGDRTIGLVAAGLVAAAPHLGFLASLGFNEGTALLTTTAVTLALARLAGAGTAGGRGPIDGLRWARILGGCAAAAALCRPMSALYAGVAVALALAVTWRRRQAPLLATAAWLIVPAIAISGGWYLRNVALYGDPTGSSALFEKFDRTSNVSLWTSLTAWRSWLDAFRTIVTRRMESPPIDIPGRLQWIAVAIAIVGVGAAVALVARDAARAHRTGPAPRSLPVVAWACMAAMAITPLVLAAQHRAGGGALHARYLVPALPIAAAAMALAAVRLATRWAGIALIVGLAALTWIQTRRSAAWLSTHLAGPAGSVLSEPTGGVAIRSLGLAASLAGVAMVVAAIAVPANRTDPTTVDRRD